MTLPKLVSNNAKRSGCVKPARASAMRSTRPTMTTTGAMKWPARRILSVPGHKPCKSAADVKAPPPRPPRNR